MLNKQLVFKKDNEKEKTVADIKTKCASESKNVKCLMKDDNINESSEKCKREEKNANGV